MMLMLRNEVGYVMLGFNSEEKCWCKNKDYPSNITCNAGDDHERNDK